MRIRYHIFTLIVAIFIVGAFTSCKSSMAYKKAQKRYEIGEYHKALGYFKKAKKKVKSRDTKAEITFYIAECYRKLNNSKNAVTSYKLAVRSKADMPEMYLHYGDVLLKQKKYSDARKMFLTHLEYDTANVWARNGVLICDSIAHWRKIKSRYKVSRVKELSSRKGEFCPVLTGDDSEYLYFTTNREGGNEAATLSAITGVKTNDIWMTRLDAQGKWIEPEALEGDVNSEYDEGVVAFDKSGKSMYITRCLFEAGESNGAQILKSSRSGAEWAEPQQLNFFEDSLADTLIIAHPAISKDESTIYFTSDLPGGYGGKDIWYVKSEGKNWSEPVNAGPYINTPGDEMFPTLRNDSTLYFSSNGLPGFGGLDIYKAVFNWKDSTVAVANMWLPINSVGDDFGITFANDQERGFFSSNRKDRRGADHIYAFIEPEIEVLLTGVLTDDKSNDPLSDAIIRLIGNDGTNTKIRTRKNGSFSYQIDRNTEYVFLVTSRGYLNQKGEFSTNDVKDSKKYKFDFALSSISKPIQLNNIFFEFGTAKVTEDSKVAIDELVTTLKDNPNIKIELSAHTDMIGESDINLRLSKGRAQSVADYLIMQGINRKRLVTKGYGEDKPVVVSYAMTEKYSYLKEGDILDEEYIKKLNDKRQEEVNQINRRMEFKVLSTAFRSDL